MAGTSAKGPPKQLRRSTRSTSNNTSTSQPSVSTSQRGRKRACQNSPPQETMDQPAQPQRKKKKETPSYLCRSDNDIASDPNRHTFLGRLPPEILMEVANVSPITTAVCLTLTCKLALATLGTQWWTRYLTLVKQGQRDETIYANHVLFLKLLCQDVKPSEYEFCLLCTALHAPLKPPAEHVKTKLTQSCQGHYIDYLPRGPNGGYNLLLAHIATAFERKFLDAKYSLEHLAGTHHMSNANLRYTMTTTADWVKDNLILRHEYIFNAPPGSYLDPGDILNLPLRLCPHQSTSRQPPPRSRYLNDKKLNAPLLTRSILSTFWEGLYKDKEFRAPTQLEEIQMSTVNQDGFLFACSKCPTKWGVAHSHLDHENKKRKQPQQITLTAFHCFGKTFAKASKYFPAFVRRAGSTLGAGKRNDEWWSEGRTFPHFEVE
ncbi:hypothetical protein PG984_009958 [Apiospora sp. TS-2023a]